jgi:nicotinate-nucleotide adenylyltransferase
VKPRRAALFGGTFDPVHKAHVALARSALDDLGLERVLWVPAGRPWQKAHRITAAEHRVAMLRLALGDEPRYAIDMIEVERAGASYTLDTVQALHAREPETEWVLLMGRDQYAGLHTWDRWRELLALVVLAVANRPGPQPAVDPEVLRHPHRVLPLDMLDISSTDIRQRVAAGQDISQLVPPEVARYIARHGLYRDATAAPAAAG